MYVLRSKEIKLSDTVLTTGDRAALADWIATGGSLARGAQTDAFEREIAAWLGVRHAIMVNSGASANLVMAYALKEGGRLRNMRAIVPALSRPTTVAPLLQLGFQVSLCDCDAQTLNIDLDQLERAMEADSPALLVLPHTLGVPCDMARVVELCARYDVILLEDAREAMGSAMAEQKLGTFGTAASFSLREGYQLSTIEGGLIVTNDDDLHQLMLSLRAYGNAAELGPDRRNQLRQRLGHVNFGAQSGFLHAGFGLNGSEVNAFLGRRQIPRLAAAVERRMRNREILTTALGEMFTQTSAAAVTSCNAFGTLVRNRDEVVDYLRHARVDSRALIAPNIARLPFWYAQMGKTSMPVAGRVHDMGLSLPLHSGLTEMEMVRIADVLHRIADPG
ncbi:DegT/DnrJ/EryC1/StrS aminotransferase family protein [Epibacterium ulvae]|uniref:DegT/DnrJ/EryC1/StrS family aminotransferase n=1 Tax=Epibacterium ulvae TaxID=1156985 RepID=UPI001BFBFADB|nr:DegT/DnrJ/EryC1/StrS aminotransferase family protein [Epibacterium ulvae]MBT8152458.1 DegT/DnrJ/EryC1/StrS aminotransferase family protein [Epibacterium ulvae]